MRKILVTLCSITLAFGSAVGAIAPPTAVMAGAIGTVKGSGPTIYWFAANGKRYVFPTANTYFSWFSDYTSVATLTDTQLYSIPIGGNVTYRPGVRLIKITTDPRVYAVGRYGMLRHITSESLAAQLYGANWSRMVDDIPDEFFVNYTIGAPINSASDFDPHTEVSAVWRPEENISIQASTRGSGVPTAPVSPPATSVDPSQLMIGVSDRFIQSGGRLILNATWNNTVVLADLVELVDTRTNAVIHTCRGNFCSVGLNPVRLNNETSITFKAVAKMNDGREIFTKLFPSVTLGTAPVLQGSITLVTDKTQVAPNEKIRLTSTLSGLNVSPVEVELNYYDERNDRWVGGCRTPGANCYPSEAARIVPGKSNTFRYYVIAKHYVDGRQLPKAYTDYITISSPTTPPTTPLPPAGDAASGRLEVDRTSIYSGQMTTFTFTAPTRIPAENVYVEFWKADMDRMVWSCARPSCTGSAANWSNGYPDTRYYANVYNRAPGTTGKGTLVTTVYSPTITFLTYTVCPSTICTYPITPGPLAQQASRGFDSNTALSGAITQRWTHSYGETVEYHATLQPTTIDAASVIIRVYDAGTGEQLWRDCVGTLDCSFTLTSLSNLTRTLYARAWDAEGRMVESNRLTVQYGTQTLSDSY